VTAPSKPCLLVVDDEPEICESVAYLVGRKFRVLKAHGAAEAVEMMAANDVQIIMTDQRMPDMTGIEMLQKLKSEYPEAVRILFTGYADIGSVVAAINQGHVYRYLTKPWQADELEAILLDAASEYSRIVAHARELRECHDQIAHLQAELDAFKAEVDAMRGRFREMEERIAHLEEENAGLKASPDRREG